MDLNRIDSDHRARVFHRWKGEERRNVEALLSTMSLVPEFTMTLFRPFDGVMSDAAPVVESFTEFGTKDLRVDGFVRVTGRNSTLGVIVEVKTGSESLIEQVQKYSTLLHTNASTMILTVSNDIGTPHHRHQTWTPEHGSWWHLSWSEVLAATGETIKQVESDGRGGSVPAHKELILRDLHGFLTRKESGTQRFDRMGRSWRGDFRAGNKPRDVVGRWLELVGFCCVALTCDGVGARLVQPRVNVCDWLDREAGAFEEHGMLSTGLHVLGNQVTVSLSPSGSDGKDAVLELSVRVPLSRRSRADAVRHVRDSGHGVRALRYRFSGDSTWYTAKQLDEVADENGPRPSHVRVRRTRTIDLTDRAGTQGFAYTCRREIEQFATLIVASTPHSQTG